LDPFTRHFCLDLWLVVPGRRLYFLWMQVVWSWFWVVRVKEWDPLTCVFTVWVFFPFSSGLDTCYFFFMQDKVHEMLCQIWFVKVGCSSDDLIYLQYRSNSWKWLLWDAAQRVEMKWHLRSLVRFLIILSFWELLFVSFFFCAALNLLC
jgi:hypothetical protein